MDGADYVELEGEDSGLYNTPHYSISSALGGDMSTQSLFTPTVFASCFSASPRLGNKVSLFLKIGRVPVSLAPLQRGQLCRSHICQAS